MKNLHEQYTDFDLKSGPSNRNFGLTFACAFTILAVVGSYKYAFSLRTISIYIILAVALLLTTLIKADSLKHLNYYWTLFGTMLHKITTPIIMFIIYAVVFIPIGIILKLTGKNSMLIYKNGANSFWINKPKAELPDPMKYQF